MATYSAIEEVSALPRDGNGGPEGWGFHMWSGALLDDEAPHRQLIERFAAAHPEAGISLPQYDRAEDHVQCTAAWNGETISIYYETILSHLSLWSSNREALEAFRAALLPFID